MAKLDRPERGSPQQVDDGRGLLHLRVAELGRSDRHDAQGNLSKAKDGETVEDDRVQSGVPPASKDGGFVELATADGDEATVSREDLLQKQRQQKQG